MNFKNIDKAGVVRLTLMLLALINQGLVMLDKTPIKFDEKQVDVTVSLLFTFVTGVVGWYYNNPTSKENRIATRNMRRGKELNRQLEEKREDNQQ